MSETSTPKTVKELKELVPLSDISEIKPGARYIIRFPKETTHENMEHAAKLLRQSKLRGVILLGDDVKFYELP